MKSSFTSDEVVGHVIGEMKRYYQNENFDKGELRALLKLSLINLESFLKSRFNVALLTKEVLLSNGVIGADRIFTYSLSSIDTDIDEPLGLRVVGSDVVGTGRIDLKSYQDLVGHIQNRENDGLPVGAILGEVLHVYFGTVDAADVKFVYKARIVLEVGGKIGLQDEYIPLFITWTARMNLRNSAKEIPNSMNNAINEHFQLLGLRNG